MYNFNHLYYFYITAKSGGVNLAAKHLLISQPSLSSQLKVLERSLDIRLFQKVGRNNRLTIAGALIFGYCRQMFEISEQMEEMITTRIPSAARRIHIGVSDEIDESFVVEVVSLFMKKHGQSQRPKVTVITGTHESLSEKLRFRELDVVVSQKAMIETDLQNLDHAEVPVVLICSSQNKMKSKKKSALPMLLKEMAAGEECQWLMPSSRLKLRVETDQFLESEKLRGRVIFESDVIGSLVRSVIDGVGFAFLPVIYVAREIREKSVRSVGPAAGYWQHRVWLSCHFQNKNDVLMLALSKAFKEICNSAG